jgi:hypothetical protein
LRAATIVAMANKKEKKIANLKRLRGALLQIFPQYSGRDFLCPICLRSFDLDATEGATDAHILPQAAGGKLAAYTCSKCNSDAHFDKWFGEHVRLRRSGGSIFDSPHQRGRLKIDGVPLGGTIGRAPDGTINILVMAANSSPESLRAFNENLQRASPKVVEVKFDLLSKKRDVHIGALQAAYLTFFRAFGYVPVFQRSLDIVREQLQHPNSDVLGRQFSCTTNEDLGHDTGIAIVNGRRCFFVAICDIVVFLPFFGDDRLYSELPADYKTASVTWHSFVGPPTRAGFSYAIALNDELLLWPDGLENGPADFRVVYLTSLDAPITIRKPITPSEAKRLLAESDTSVVAVHMQTDRKPEGRA